MASRITIGSVEGFNFAASLAASAASFAATATAARRVGSLVAFSLGSSSLGSSSLDSSSESSSEEETPNGLTALLSSCVADRLDHFPEAAEAELLLLAGTAKRDVAMSMVRPARCFIRSPFNRCFNVCDCPICEVWSIIFCCDWANACCFNCSYKALRFFFFSRSWANRSNFLRLVRDILEGGGGSSSSDEEGSWCSSCCCCRSK